MLIVLPLADTLTMPVPLIEDVAGTFNPDSEILMPLVLSVMLPLMLVPPKPVLVPAIFPDA